MVVLTATIRLEQISIICGILRQSIGVGPTGPLQGWMLDRYGPKRIARIGSFFLIAVLWFSQIRVFGSSSLFLLIAIGAGLELVF